MNAVPFDTLKMAKRLEAVGFPAVQAAGAAEALAEALTGADLATKGDIDGLRTEIKGDHNSLRAEMISRFEMQRRDMELLRRDMTIKLGSFMFVAVGVLLAAMRYMTLHS